MIGTSIHLKNSDHVLYPSVTICSESIVASFCVNEINCDSEEKLVDSQNQAFTLAQNPDLSDMLLELSNTHGPIKNMSKLVVDSTNVATKSYVYSHYAIDADPSGGTFEVKYYCTFF